jgi:NAD+ kinase
MREIKKVLLYHRKDGKRKDEQQSFEKLLLGICKKNDIEMFTQFNPEKKYDLVVAAGGDGTFLDAAHIAFEQDIPIAGINIGHLGFLVEIDPNEADVLDDVLKGKFKMGRRMMIDVSIIRENEEIFHTKALNEVTIHRNMKNSMLTLGIEYNNEELPEYKCDGVIIATPTGSTAYNLSINGPILYPSEESFVVNAMAPHALTHRPLVLPADNGIKVTMKECEVGILTCDGRKSVRMLIDDEVIVNRSEKELIYIPHPTRSFFNILSQKLHLGKRL